MRTIVKGLSLLVAASMVFLAASSSQAFFGGKFTTLMAKLIIIKQKLQMESLLIFLSFKVAMV